MDADVEPHEPGGAPPRRRRLLVVDDDPTIRMVLALNFEDEGYDVHLAADGEQALARARALHPDVMVLDVMMPGTDGYTVLRALRSSPQTDDIPVVLLSARASDAEVFEGWQSGADSYLTKPFEVDQLIRLVASVVAAAGADGQALAGVGDVDEAVGGERA